MKGKVFFHSSLVYIAILTGMVSCTLEQYEEPAEETYTKTFIKEFGLIDTNQDWNMAMRQSVTVNTATSSEVKIFSIDNGSYTLVGDYSDVMGQQTLNFDLLRGSSEVLVTCGCHAKVVTVGGAVDFSQSTTRAIQTYDNGGFKVEATEDYKYFGGEYPYGDVTQFETVVPEHKDNRGNVINNFLGNTSNGGNTTIYMYPVYWNTAHGTSDSYPDQIGIAYKDDNGTIQHIPIYNIKSGDELQGSNDQKTWTSIGSAQASKDDTNYKYYRSRGIKITLPKDIVYGFYISVHEGNVNGNGYNVYNYSYADWNDAPYYNTSWPNSKSESDATGHAVYVGVFNDTIANGSVHTYMTFEDWSDGLDAADHSDHDLNDVVVMFDPALDIVDEGSQNEWIIAGEDLGSTDDFDFNDIVFSVSHVAGSTKATVKALAAGGTLPLYLFYDGKALNDGKEFHKWFGENVTSEQIINTYEGNGNAYTGESVDITVDKDFTMTSHSDVNKKNGVINMGGFTFTVTNKDASTTNLTAPQKGTAPQMICMPNTWQWPIERTPISEAYTEFGEWGANYTKTGWLGSMQRDKVIERKRR